MKFIKLDYKYLESQTRTGKILLVLSWICPILASVFYCIVLILPNWEKTEFNFDLFISENNTKFMLTDKLYDVNNVMVGFKLRYLNESDKIRCLMNMQGGLWSICDSISESSRLSSSCQIYDVFKTTNQCFNYLKPSTNLVTDTFKFADKNLYFIKMQNNVISCAIMVVICMLFAFGLSIISITFQLVICGMVAAVLYAMAALFSVFASAIQNEKVKLLQTDKQCHNYTPLHLPVDLCPYTMKDSFSATTQWPFVMSLIGSVLFVMSSVLWIMVTRNLRLRKTKEYI